VLPSPRAPDRLAERASKRFSRPEEMSAWALPEIPASKKQGRATVSMRPHLRALIEDKIAMARTSESHRNALASYADDLVERDRDERRLRAVEVRKGALKQLQEFKPQIRREKLRQARKAHEDYIEVARRRRDDIEQEFYDGTREAMRLQAERHAEAIRQSYQRQWFCAVYASLFAVNLVNRVAGISTPSRNAMTVMPDAQLVKRKLLEGRTKLDRFILAFAQRKYVLGVRMVLVRAVAHFVVLARRARFTVATRQVSYTLGVLAKASRMFMTVKRFYMLVKRTQRFARSFLRCSTARRELLRRQLDHVYQSIWNSGGASVSKAVKQRGKKRDTNPSKVVARSLDEEDVADIVTEHLRALRHANGRALARYVKAQTEAAEQRHRWYYELVRKYEDEEKAPPTWREITAHVNEKMGAVPQPRRPVLKALSSVDVLAAQLRGLLASIPHIDGASNPTDAMITVPTREQSALTAFTDAAAARRDQRSRGPKKADPRKSAHVQPKNPEPLPGYPPPPGGWKAV
jgi:hypothetical protein